MIDEKTRVFNYNGHKLVSIPGREAFPGERVSKLPTEAIEFAKSQPLTSSLLPCHIGYVPHAKGQKVSRPNGDGAFTLLFCLEGCGTVRLDNGSHRMGRGMVVLLRPFERHAYVADDRHPWSFYWIHFNGTQGQQYYDLLTGAGRNVCIDVQPDVGFVQSFEKILNLYHEGNAYRMLVAAAGTLHQLLSDLYLSALARGIGQAGPRERIERTLEVMRHNPGMQVSMHELAAIAHLSHSQYALHFRRNTGKSPRNYFIRLKIAKACEHLVQTTAKIENIAQFVGYEDPFYFCRLFKRVVGRTPTQFRHNPISIAFLTSTDPAPAAPRRAASCRLVFRRDLAFPPREATRVEGIDRTAVPFSA